MIARALKRNAEDEAVIIRTQRSGEVIMKIPKLQTAFSALAFCLVSLLCVASPQLVRVEKKNPGGPALNAGVSQKKVPENSGVARDFSNLRNPAVKFNRKVSAAPASATPAGSTLMGTFYSYQNQGRSGIFEIPTDGSQPGSVLAEDVNGMFGGVIADGKYYVCYAYGIEFGFPNDYLVPVVSVYDTQTWELEDEFWVPFNFLSYDMAYDNSTGNIYGCFYDEEAQGQQFGIVDYYNNTRTTIRVLDEPWRAISFDPQGTLWAVTESGKVIKADKTNGNYQQIAETGLTLDSYCSGSFDPVTGRFFLGLNSSEDTNGLYEIDLTSGEATLVCDYDSKEHILGISFMPVQTAQGAPGVPENLEVSFDGGSTNGKVMFTAPSQTHGGTPLEGEMDWTVMIDGTKAAEGKTLPGDRNTVDVVAPTTGRIFIEVTCSNQAGQGEAASTRYMVGYGVPKPTRNVKAAWANDVSTVTWEPVTESADGGYMDPSKVTYTVTRYPEGMTVGENISATTFSDNLAVDAPAEYYYGVKAVYEGNVSEESTSNSVMAGHMELPYYNALKTPIDLKEFTIIDANNDGRTWTNNKGQTYVRYNPGMEMDDWLITVPFAMKKNESYHIAFETYCDDAQWPEKIEVKAGNGIQASDMIYDVISPLNVDSETPMTVEGWFSPDEDGDYTIGFHGISEADRLLLYLGEVRISVGMAPTAPSAPTDLKSVADPAGNMSVNLSAQLPTTDISGERLQKISRAELYRDNTLINTWTDPEPGSQVTFTDDKVPGSGIHEYALVCTTDTKRGQSAYSKVFVGINVPGAPRNVKTAYGDNFGELALSWEAPEIDADGYPIDPSHISYLIADVTDPENPVLVEKDIKGLNRTLQIVDADADQVVKQYGVFAVTKSGTGKVAVSDSIILGQPYKDLFVESVPNGQLEHAYIIDKSMNGTNVDIITTDQLGVRPVAEGCGAINFLQIIPEHYSSLTTGNIALGEEKQNLSFYIYGIPTISDGSKNLNVLDVLVREKNQEWEPLHSLVCGDYQSGWKNVLVSLEGYKGKTVQLMFKVTCKNAVQTPIALITVGTICDHNLEVRDILVPEWMEVNREFTVSANVYNRGTKPASGYKVELYHNDVKVAEKACKTLSSNQRNTVSFKQQLQISDISVHKYAVNVVYPEDEIQENNMSAEASVELLYPAYPAPSDLNYKPTDEGCLLTWAAPATDRYAAPKTETFANAPAFRSEVDGWTFVDRDGAPMGGFSGVTLPNMTTGVTTASFFVWDQDDPSVASLSGYANALSGSKMLVALRNYQTSAAPDDWAISPELPGVAQNLFFNARSIDMYTESLEVLVSSTGNDPDDFVKVMEIDEIPSEWTMYSVKLPEGTKYFAFRHFTNSGMLMIDDVEFATEFLPIDLKGYNVYCDGQRINSQTVTGKTFTAPDPVEGSTYFVTAVYDLGESRPSNSQVYDLSGVESVNDSLKIQSSRGRISISGAEGKEVRIVSVSGMNVFSGIGTNLVEVDVLPGVYVVTVEGRAFRIFVK